jgi:nucleotide-binding universal stress UspA family protein
MQTSRYKILVLSDLKKSTSSILKSTISLAKIIDADINMFHVTNPSDVVKKESQLSAIRSMNHKHIAVNKKMQTLASSFFKDYGTTLEYNFTFGKVKNEIEAHIEATKPDIIVIGKKKSNTFDFIGDNITQLVLKQHNGVIMIVDENNTIEPNLDLSLGILNSKDNKLNINFADALISHGRQPLKSFKIVQNAQGNTIENSSSNNKVIEYVFEKGDDSLKYLSNYLIKSKVNLLYVDRAEDTGNVAKENTTVALDIKTVISTLNVSLLLTSKT